MTVGIFAGNAFITVKPSLRGWDKRLKDQLGKTKTQDHEVPVPAPDDSKTERRGRESGTKFVGAFDREVRSLVKKALTALPELQIGASSSAAEQQIRDLTVELQELSGKRIGVDVDAATALADLQRIRGDLDELRLAGNLSIDVNANTTLASAQLGKVQALAASVAAAEPTVDVDVDTGAATGRLVAFRALAQRLLRKVTLRVDVDRGLTSFLGNASGGSRVLLGLFAALAPALVPLGAVLVSLAATAVGAFTAAAGGVGILLAAVLGNILPVIKAQSELEAKQKAATSAGRSYAGAQDQVASAARGVAQAQKSAARAVADAQRGLADARRQASRSAQSAERGLADAQRRAQAAQEALNATREDARRRLAAYRDQLRGAALDESGAALAVTAAQEALNAVLFDPGSTQLQLDQARQALAEAEFAYAESQTRRKELTAEAEKAAAAGIDGDAQVAAARDDVAEADRGVADAVRELQQARADGARAVADAERTLARARADGADQVAAAQQALAQAQAAAAAAGADQAAAQAELAENLSKVSGPATVFVAALDRAKAAWRGFVDETAMSSFGVAAQGLDLFSRLLPQLVPLANGAAGAVSILLADFDQFANGPVGQAFLEWMTSKAPDAIVTIGRAFGNLLVGIGGLVGALYDADTGFLDLTRRFANFGRNAGRNRTLEGFVEYAQRVGPVVGAFLGSLFRALGRILQAAAPVGIVIYKALKLITDGIQLIPLPVLTALVAGFAAMGAVGLVVKIFAGIINSVLVTALRALFGLILANPIIAVIALIVGALIFAYHHFEGFRNFVDGAFTLLKNAAIAFYEKGIKPAFESAGKVIGFIWENILKPVFNAWKFYFTEILFPVVKFLYENVVKPIFTALGDFIGSTWRDKVKPVLEALGGFISGTVAPLFQKGVDGIKAIWETLKRAVGTPVKFVIETIYNEGIRKALNKIPGVNLAPAEVPRAIAGYASGGVLPGYTPGRDVHRFYSPTAGYLDLSGGEGIMRPEWVRQNGGAAGVARENALARKRAAGQASFQHSRIGDRAGREAGARMGAFFLGGVLPLPGATSIRQHTSGYSFARWAGDLNAPADEGKPIVAWKPGTVAYVISRPDSYGNHVGVNHGSGGSTLYAHMSGFATRPGAQVNAGSRLGYVGSTGNSSGPHLHFEVRGNALSAPAGQAGASGAGGGGGGGGGSRIPNPLKLLKLDEWTAALRRMGAWGDLLTNTAGNIVGRAKTFGEEKLKAAYGKIKSFAGDVLEVAAGGGTNLAIAGGIGNVKQQVRGVANRYGWGDGSQWSSIEQLVQKESGWNPRAANPNSSARGLFQKRTSIHGPVEETAAGQAEWGLRYIKGRYGTPNGAWSFHQRNGYYDQGGLAIGAGFLQKATLRPERVLSPEQTAAFERLVATLEGFDSGTRTISRGVDAGAPWVFDVDEFSIDNWEEGLGTMRLVATRAAGEVYSEQRSHERRVGSSR